MSESKFMKFVYDDEMREWEVKTKRTGEWLGSIEYYDGWSCWVFRPVSDTIFSDECMEDIIKKIKEISEKGSL